MRSVCHLPEMIAQNWEHAKVKGVLWESLSFKMRECVHVSPCVSQWLCVTSGSEGEWSESVFVGVFMCEKMGKTFAVFVCDLSACRWSYTLHFFLSRPPSGHNEHIVLPPCHPSPTDTNTFKFLSPPSEFVFLLMYTSECLASKWLDTLLYAAFLFHQKQRRKTIWLLMNSFNAGVVISLCQAGLKRKLTRLESSYGALHGKPAHTCSKYNRQSCVLSSNLTKVSV